MSLQLQNVLKRSRLCRLVCGEAPGFPHTRRRVSTFRQKVGQARQRRRIGGEARLLEGSEVFALVQSLYVAYQAGAGHALERPPPLLAVGLTTVSSGPVPLTPPNSSMLRSSDRNRG